MLLSRATSSSTVMCSRFGSPRVSRHSSRYSSGHRPASRWWPTVWATRTNSAGTRVVLGAMRSGGVHTPGSTSDSARASDHTTWSGGTPSASSRRAVDRQEAKSGSIVAWKHGIRELATRWGTNEHR